MTKAYRRAVRQHDFMIRRGRQPVIGDDLPNPLVNDPGGLHPRDAVPHEVVEDDSLDGNLPSIRQDRLPLGDARLTPLPLRLGDLRGSDASRAGREKGVQVSPTLERLPHGFTTADLSRHAQLDLGEVEVDEDVTG